MLYVIAFGHLNAMGKGKKMKSLVLALLVSVSAQAFNTEYEKAVFQKSTVVKNKKNNSAPVVVSFLVETKSKDGARPAVVNITPKSLCSYKQSLINYSAYNRATKMFEITYEVQITVHANRNNRSCSLLIKPNLYSQVKESARITIL